MSQKNQLTGDEEIDRALLWKQARTNKNGEFEGDPLIETVVKIDEYIQQKSEGSFSSINLTDDILSQALGKPESSGRIKGVGRYVTSSNYLSICSDSVKGQEITLLRQEIGMMKSRMDQMEELLKRGASQEEKGSCSIQNEVVSLDKDEIELIPKKVKKKDSPKKSLKLTAQDIPPSLRLLHIAAKHAIGEDGSIEIPVDEDVYGQKQRNLFILFEDIHHFCELNPIGASCISSYILHLYKMCANMNFLNKIRFVDPYAVSSNLNVVEKADLVGRRLIGTTSKQLVFVSCNTGFHWILLVIDAHVDKLYVLDPLDNKIHYAEWIDIIEMAMKIFKHSIGRRGTKFDWEVVKCPQQPDGKQCGYYVMHYMKDIIDGTPDSLPLTDMFNPQMYHRSEIDEVRKDWGDFVQTYLD